MRLRHAIAAFGVLAGVLATAGIVSAVTQGADNNPTYDSGGAPHCDDHIGDVNGSCNVTGTDDAIASSMFGVVMPTLAPGVTWTPAAVQEYPTTWATPNLATPRPCAWVKPDVDYTCNISAIDIARVKSLVGAVVMPTYTPTFTATPTNTPTATPTATPTITVAQLLDHSTGDHDGTLCTPPSNYSWGEHGRIHTDAPPSNAGKIKWWGTAQWTACDGSEAANTVITFSNGRSYSWDGTDWGTAYGSSISNWCAELDPPTTDDYEACTGSGSVWTMPVDDPAWSPEDRALHWASAAVTIRSGALCHVVLYDVSKTGSGSVMVNTGFDYYTSTEGYIGDAWVGSYVAVTSATRIVGGSNCSESVLTNNPPPGVQP